MFRREGVVTIQRDLNHREVSPKRKRGGESERVDAIRSHTRSEGLETRRGENCSAEEQKKINEAMSSHNWQR